MVAFAVDFAVMMSASKIEGGRDEAVFSECSDGIGHSLLARDVNHNPCVLELGHGAHSDASHGDGIDHLAFK